MLSYNPTDVVVVTKPGSGSQISLQSAQAIDVYQQKPENCNFHIMEEFHRHILAVEASPYGLASYQMNA